MKAQTAGQVDAAVESGRRRGQGYLGYLLWVFMILGLLWTANLVVTLFERWIELLHHVRTATGISAPPTGPDWWVLSGVGFLIVVACALALWAYGAYRSAWNRRLALAWGPAVGSDHTRILKLQAVATDATLRRKSEYLRALLSGPIWKRDEPDSPPLDRECYRIAAKTVLREIEVDIAHRAVTAGLVIGLNRNPLIDSLTIAATALELQLHVLTRLGKRPSLRVWIELVKRTSASIFLNTYVTREDALYLNLAIRKAALGLEVASDAVQNTLEDIDLDEILGHTTIPGLSELTQVASVSMSVGASGLRYLGNFIEYTANDLLQGVIAGGVLYYHGMALAAECLALDEEHRHSPDMTRTISQAMTVASVPAGRLLRDGVRKMREFLRERRRQVFSAARGNVSGAAGKVRDAVLGLSDRASGLFRNSP
jgi:hypothetical protein